jgi:hypothetical protein
MTVWLLKENPKCRGNLTKQAHCLLDSPHVSTLTHDDCTPRWDSTVADVPQTLWDRDVLEDMGVILTMGDQAFFDDIVEHEQLGLTGLLKGITTNPKGHCPPRASFHHGI